MQNKITELHEQIDDAQHDLQILKNREIRLKNRAKYRRSMKDRKRTHRLILYGAALEAQHHELEVLGDHEVFELIEKFLEIPAVADAIDAAVHKHCLEAGGDTD